MKSNLSFSEWLEERDPELHEGLGKGVLGAGLAGLGIWAGSHFMGNKDSSAPAPSQPAAAKVSTVGSPKADMPKQQAQPKKSAFDHIPPGASRSLSVLDRDEKKGIWRFTAKGYSQREVVQAQKEAEGLVRDELLQPYTNYEFGKGRMSKTVTNARIPGIISGTQDNGDGTVTITVRTSQGLFSGEDE